MVAYESRFASGVGYVYIMVEYSHGKGNLSQLAVAHNHIGLKPAVLRRAHTREIDAILRFPIMLLKVAQMVCHHANVRPPLFLQTDEHSHTDGMYACLPHTVKAVYAPFEFGLHATRVVYVIVRLVVGLLKTDDAVHAMRLQFGIFFGFQGHYFNLQVAEIRLCQVECAGNVRNACLGGIFTCNQQQVLKRRELLDSLVLIDNFLLRQYGTGHGIADVKTTVHTGVGAGVRNI